MTVWIKIDGTQRRVDLPLGALNGGPAIFKIDGKVIEADAHMVQPGVLSLIVDGKQYRCALDGDSVVFAEHRVVFVVTDPRSLAAQKGTNAVSGGARSVKAPMPGRVVRVLVQAGDTVEEHQGLVVIEAMKMQNELKSPKAGRVVKLAVEVGATVASGDVLAVVE